MRTPIYRNLDNSLRLMGFHPYELIILCFILVGGGEICQFFSISRGWALLFTGCLAGLIFWMNRALGEQFIPRLVRFIKLPSQTRPEILDRKRL